MKKVIVDNNQKFDFGKASKEYAKYRDIYPKEIFEKLYSVGVGVKNSYWLDLGTGTGVIPRGLAQYGAHIFASDISKNQIDEAKNLSCEFNNIQYQVCPAEEVNFPDNYFNVITSCQCFWYFDPQIIVPKIKSMLRPNGLFLKLYMSYLKDDPIAIKSHALVKKLNPNWIGSSAAVQDLRNHYFENPYLDNFIIDLPFTKESWHGRIMASRGVLASMSAETLAKFEAAHLKLLADLPDKFTVKHKIFLTYYNVVK